MTTTRLSHTGCLHDATPAGRKACRDGNAVLRSAKPMDMIRVDGVNYSVRSLTYFAVIPNDAQVSTWSLADGWTSLGWLPATTFAGGVIITD